MPLIVETIVERPRSLDIRCAVDRPALEQLCASLLERSLATCKEALDTIGLAPEDMTQVVVTGGISHIPFIRAGV